MSGDVKDFKPVRNYTDSNGVIDNALIRQGGDA
jgi:hypothetical protein